MSFSASDAALAGFRLAKDKPRVVLRWAAFYLVVCAAILVLLGLLMGPKIASEALAAVDNRPGDPTAFIDLLQSLASAGRGGEQASAAVALLQSLSILVVVTLGLGVGISATVIAAVFRAVLRPEESGWAYLRFGMDEVRLIVVIALLSLPVLALVAAFAVVAGVIAGLVGVANPGLPAVASLVGLLAACAAVFWVGVRLSLAPVITFAERRIRLFESWRMTRGHFWRLTAMYLLILFLSFVVSTVIGIIASMFPLLNLQALVELIQSEGASLATTAPGVFIGVVGYVVVSLLGSVLQLAIGNAPQAEAYRQLADHEAEAF